MSTILRKLALGIVVVAVAAGFTITTQAQTKGSGEVVMNSYGGAWGQAIQLGFIDSFQHETGIKVTLLSNADTAKSVAAVRSGNAPPEDVIDTELATAVAMNRDGLVAPVDYNQFDKADLDKLPAYARLPFTVGWGQFAIGVCYDKEVFKDAANAPKNWADFWNFTKFRGKRAMLSWTDEPQPEFGLIADGVPVKDLYPIDVKRAFKKLTALRAQVPKFPTSPAVLNQMLVDKQVVMIACFTHRAQHLIDGGLSRIAISFDQARLQTEYSVVWKNAPNKENAMKFLAYMIKARPQATWAQIGSTGPLNPDAFKFISTDVADKLATSPKHDKVFPKNDNWFAATGSAGKTNLELLVQQWNAWVAGR